MNQRVSVAEKSLPIMLLRAREAVMKKFRPLLKEYDLSEQQWRVLRVLNEIGPLEPTGLAEESIILMPSLTRILANLESRRLIIKKRHSADGRRQIAEISDHGRELIAEIAPKSAAIYASIEQVFDQDAAHELMKALRGLSTALSKE